MAVKSPRDVCGCGETYSVGDSTFETNHEIFDHRRI
jgi:hypothetical protein